MKCKICNGCLDIVRLRNEKTNVESVLLNCFYCHTYYVRKTGADVTETVIDGLKKGVFVKA